jgi:quinol monooxygenase YgiN
MGRFVIVAYQPKPGMAQQLDAVVAKHLQVLAAEQLVTDRPAYVMRSKDGTVVEVFEWRSAEAIQRAHTSPTVGALWAEFAAVCDYVPLATLPEAQQMFAEFEPIALPTQG